MLITELLVLQKEINWMRYEEMKQAITTLQNTLEHYLTDAALTDHIEQMLYTDHELDLLQEIAKANPGDTLDLL